MGRGGSNEELGAELTLAPPLRGTAKRHRRDSPPARGRKEAELELEGAGWVRERRAPPTPTGAVNAMDMDGRELGGERKARLSGGRRRRG